MLRYRLLEENFACGTGGKIRVTKLLALSTKIGIILFHLAVVLIRGGAENKQNYHGNRSIK